VGAWDVVSSIITVLAACTVAVLALGCVWPINQPRRPTPARKPARARCPLRPVQWPAEWTCATPTHPFTLADAHHWMQAHRDHDCARKRAAFDALVAAGRIAPDSFRQSRPRRSNGPSTAR
jgi:hypothetical protein